MSKTEFTMYGVSLSQGQKEKIARAIKKNGEITLRLKAENLTGSDMIALSPQKISRIEKLKTEKKGGEFTLTRSALKFTKDNHMSGGGFLATLLPIVASLLPGIGGMIGGIGTAVGANRGSGLKKKRSKKTKGKGLYLGS